MTKATELFKTLDDLRPYVGEVWEDDSGIKRTLLFVGSERVFAAGRSGSECSWVMGAWIYCNNLPISIRNAPKPEMVTKEFWEVVYWSTAGNCRLVALIDNWNALEEIKRSWTNVLIRPLPPAEYEVIRKDGV